MDGEALLDGLNDEQREAVTTAAAPLRILAAAGSGKTRVLTRRIAYRAATGSADARHVLAITFTRKAAGELTNRLRALGLRERLTAGTFHAVAFALLRQRWAEQHRSAPDLLDRKGRILLRMLPKGVQLADLAGEIEWAKARLVGPRDYASAAVAAGRRPPLDPHQVAQLYQRYEDEKRKRGVLDFDDLLLQCAGEIERDPAYAAAQRWRFQHLFVDEFQDVNPLQLRLLEAWLGGRADLCVVGDPNQAIYGWNGADASALVDFEQRFAGRDRAPATVALPRNYRSSPQVLALANRTLDAGAVRGLRLVATRADGPIPQIHAYRDDVHEARAIARLARDAQGPSTPWSHQAVLTRTNAQTVVIAEALSAAHIPAVVRGQAPFLEQPEIRDALRALQRDRRDFVTAIAALEIAAGLVDDDGIDDDDDDALLDLSDAELARRANLAELVRLATEYRDTDPAPSAGGFGAWLTATFAGSEPEVGRDAVTITTAHAAKGLEWPVVYVAGLEEGLFPIFHAKTREAIEEERRLFYVAITRAERELHLSWAEQRGGRPTRRRPSPYLDELAPVLDALRAGATPADATTQVARARATVRAARGSAKVSGRVTVDPTDQPLVDALKQWRSRRSRAASVPAYVVFDDKTLAAIAARRPSAPAELLAVPGIGPTKLERFGAEVLDIVARHSQG